MEGESALWKTLAFGCYFALIGGHVYAYSIWSEPILNKLSSCENDNITNLYIPSTNTLFQAVVIGNYIPFAGFFYDYFGLSISINATILASMGYFGLYFLSLSSSLLCSSSNLGIFLLFFFLFLIGLGSTLTDISYLACNLKNFGKYNSSSLVAGLLKSFYGLSASFLILFSQSNSSASNSSSSSSSSSSNNFLLFLGFITFTIPLLRSQLTELPSTLSSSLDSSSSSSLNCKESLIKLIKFQFFLVILIFMINLINISFKNLSFYINYLLISLFLLCFFSFLLFTKSRSNQFNQLENTQKDFKHSENETNQSRNILDDYKEELKWRETIKHLKFYLLLFPLTIGMGGGLVLIGNSNNILNIKFNYKISNTYINTFVSILSISNCLGRLLTPILINFYSSFSFSFCFNSMSINELTSNSTSSLLQDQDQENDEFLEEKEEKSEENRKDILVHVDVLILSLFLMSLGHYILSFSSFTLSLFSSFLIGFSYGSFWTLSPSLVYKIFGNKYFAQNISLFSIAPSFGSIFISEFIFSQFLKIINQKNCRQLNCFQSFHFIYIVFICLAIVSSFALKKFI